MEKHDEINLKHNQGHVTGERINEQHTRMTREQIGINHGEYRQGKDGCYICSLLLEREALLELIDAQDALLVVYRTGHHARIDGVLDRLKAAREALKGE